MKDLRDKHVLVTGAAGFVGANLVRALLRRGAAVHALVLPASNLWRLTEAMPHLRMLRLDLGDFKALQGSLNAVRPDIVFHLAATGGHPDQRSAREETLRTNVLGTANLLEAMAPLEFQQFVHIGSSLEYGPKSKPIQELELLEPSTFRGAAKAAASLLCQQFARAAGRPLVVLRLFSVYGPWEDPDRFIPTLVRSVLHGEEVAVTPPGFRHDFVFVDDVVVACLLALEAKTAPGEVINIGSGEQRTNEEVVEIVQDICRRTVPIRPGAYPARPWDTTHWVADTRKARRLLRWAPAYTLRSGLEKTVAWFRQNLHIYDPLVRGR